VIVERWLHLLGAVLAVTLVRGAAVFLVALAVTGLAKRLAGETRHLIWLGVIGSFLLIPLAWLLLPTIRIAAGIALEPSAPLRVAAAPVLCVGEYARLVERAGPPAATRQSTLTALSPFGAIALSLVVVWLAGILVLAARLAIGKGELLGQAAQAGRNDRLQAAVDGLAGEMAVRGRIPVLLSPECRIPFAFGIIHPRILLPQEATKWPAGRLHSALTHELAHIRRRDLIVQTGSYIICVLFWFLPPLWLAYAAMLREAETCCDQQVINKGFPGPDYAQDIVELARCCEGRILLPSISSAVGRKNMLNERVKRVLSLKPGRRPFGTRGVVKVLAICLACVVPILALSAQARPAQEPLYGTWINEDFGTGKGGPQRCVIFPDGREWDYLMITDKEPHTESKLKIEKQWRDGEGNYWYTISWMGWYYGYPDKNDGTCGSKGYSLVKVNASGTTIESVQAESRIPDEEDWSLIPHPAYHREP